jgi:threonine/homoserine/homoserine lactone efflux protein
MIDLTINIPLWLAFVGATTLLILLPGPIVTLVIANSLSYGSRAGLTNIIGTTTANIIFFAIGGFGMTWLLALLSDWFLVIRWVGAAYLVYMGIRLWLTKPQELKEHAQSEPKPFYAKTYFLQGFAVAITNPKTIIFYAAFFPQFIDPTLPTGEQLLVLSITFLIIATVLDSGYAILAGKLRPFLIGEQRGRIRNRITGTLLILTGMALALTRKAS